MADFVSAAANPNPGFDGCAATSSMRLAGGTGSFFVRLKKMGLGLWAMGRVSDGVGKSDGNIAGLSDVSDPG